MLTLVNKTCGTLDRYILGEWVLAKYDTIEMKEWKSYVICVRWGSTAE